MKNKIFLFPISLSVIFFASIIIILSPLRSKKIIDISSTNSELSSPAVIILSPNLSFPIHYPQKITGLIDKSWVFEASFPIILFDDQNKVLYSGTGSAPDWLTATEKYTEFTTTLSFYTTRKTGYLKIKTDNPSGLPQNEKDFTIPVIFYETKNATN